MTNTEAQRFKGPISMDHILREVAHWSDPSYLEPYIKNGLTQLIAEFNEKNLPPETVSHFLYLRCSRSYENAQNTSTCSCRQQYCSVSLSEKR